MDKKNSNNRTQVQVGQQILVTIKRLGINGEGVGYYKGQVVFIPGALPGEQVIIRITAIEAKHTIGEIVKVKKFSPHRQKPICPRAQECGGCQLLHMSYAGQLEAKEKLVIEAFHKYTQLKPVPVRPIVGMEEPWEYRNKAQYQVGATQGKLITGLYSPNSHRLVDLSGCPVQHPEVNKIIKVTGEILQNMGIKPYNPTTGQGVIRTLVVRVSFATDEAQLTLVTRSKAIPNEAQLVQKLLKALPQLVGISQNINEDKTSIVFGEKTRLLWGQEKIRERLGDLEFHLSPRAFFQLNPQQTHKLYEYVREAAALTKQDTVVDAYCGVGTIALWLAREAKEVRGIELIPEAVRDARENAEKVGINNATFVVGKAEEILPQWVKAGFRPDVVTVDPPRTGLDQRLMDALVKVKAKRLVYVSCNPATLAKNCAYLMERGYRVEWIQPVDMFPHTAHVECVVLIERK